MKKIFLLYICLCYTLCINSQNYFIYKKNGDKIYFSTSKNSPLSSPSKITNTLQNVLITSNFDTIWTTYSFFVKIQDSISIEYLLHKYAIPYIEYKQCGSDKYVYLVSIDTLGRDKSIEYSNILFESGEVIFSQPNFGRLIYPSGNYYSEQWNLNNIGQYGGTVGMDINIEPSRVLTTGSSVKVAVLDEGVDLNHEDLCNNLIQGYDATINAPSGLNGGCADGDSHGTACAGIICAEYNEYGIEGIAYNSKLIPIRIAYNKNVNDSIWTTTDNIVIDGISKAWTTLQADVLSNSWYWSEENEAMTNEFNQARLYGRNGKGCIIIIASGNSNKPQVEYPSSIDGVISVGAIDRCGIRSGRADIVEDICDPWPNDWKPGSSYGSKLSVVAPGTNVPTTYPNNYYGYFGGTSAACPHVAGLAALILSVNPNLTAQQVKDIIEQTARKIRTDLYTYTSDGMHANGLWNEKLGYGLIDAYAAVQMAINYYCTDNDWATNTRTITENTIINAPTVWSGTNTIKSGATLTITSTLRMAPNSKIIVEPGAKLVVNGGTITNACDGSYWDGILVEGNSSLMQTEANQGTVTLKSAVIENANTAISTLGYGGDWSKTGGIVQATNTTFKNNNKSVEFMSYTNKNTSGTVIDNVSYFDRCTFVWDNDMLEYESYQGSHISMWQVRGIKITGCTFKDERTSLPSMEITHGIITNESGYIVSNYSATFTDISGIVTYLNTPTKFNNLTYGIRTSAGSTKECSVSRAEFTDNYCGIFATNSHALSVTNSTFNLPNSSQHNGDYMNSKALGISLQSSRNFTVSNNEFIGKSAQQHTAGVQIDNITFALLATDQVINNNRFDKVFAGIQSLGKNFVARTTGGIGNTGITTYNGLVIKCNSFENVSIPMYVTSQTNTNITNTQTGIKPNQGTSSSPANNEFANVNNLIHNYSSTGITYWNYSGNSIPSGTLGSVTIKSTSNTGDNCGVKGVTEETIIPIVDPPFALTSLQTDNAMTENATENEEEILDKELWASYIEQYESAYNIPTELLMELAGHGTTTGLMAIEMLYFKGIKTDYHPQVIVEDTQEEQEEDVTDITENKKSSKVAANNIKEDKVAISPNPTSSDISVTYTFKEESTYQIIISDINGTELIRETLQGNSGEQIIGLNKLPAGTYFYKITTKDRTIKTDKLVIVR